MTADAEPAVTAGRFMANLVQRAPEITDDVVEHLDFVNGPYPGDRHERLLGELLVHLLMADVLRFAVRTWHDGRRDVTAKVLGIVDDALRHGDEYVENAVCVSFVEHVGAEPGETPEFIASWPAGLLAEHERQVEWYRNWQR